MRFKNDYILCLFKGRTKEIHERNLGLDSSSKNNAAKFVLLYHLFVLYNTATLL
jgi:hypothetical protein